MDFNTAIISIFVGIAMFIIGMTMMSDGLKKSCGRGVKALFRHTGKNRLVSMGIGAGATAIIQSSAATSIMVIGFISAGVMTMFQGISMTLGAYIGTTITGILVSFSNFKGSQYFVLLAPIGVILMFFKNEKIKYIGTILAGLGLLFFGLATMSSAFQQKEINQGIQSFCTRVDNITVAPLIFLVVGALFTALVQSSSCTIGIVIVMVGNNAISVSSGIFLILGSSIGTVVPTLIASIGGNANVKRVAWICITLRTLCALIGLSFLWPFKEPISTFFATRFGNVEFGLAMYSVLYNVIFMGLALPFVEPIIALSNKVIKDKEAENKKKALKYIDNHLLGTPSLAMMQVKNEILSMLSLSYDNFKYGYHEITRIDFPNSKEIVDIEDQIDYINSAISEFLIKLSNKVTMEDERLVGSFYHMINDIERIGDHAYNFHEQAIEMKNNDLHFSDTAVKEFDTMYDVIAEMFDRVIMCFDKSDFSMLEKIHDLEEETDKLKLDLSSKHFERITKNLCKHELSPYYSTLLSELERVADHLVNIGYAFVNPTGDEK